MVQIDEHTWDDYNQLDDVERFCENYIHTANVAPKADVAREIFEDIDRMFVFIKDNTGKLCSVVRFHDIAEIKKKHEKKG